MFTDEEVLAVIDTVVEKRGADYIYPQFKDLAVKAGLYDPMQEDEQEFMLPDECHYVWEDNDRTVANALGLDVMVGEPACLVGAVLAEFGLLEKYLGDEDDNHNSAGALLGDGDDFTNESIRLLDVAQSSQDQGEPWGTARDRTRKEFAEGPMVGIRSF